MGYIPPEAMGIEFYRWLYTATTRARNSLYFLNANAE
jgi:exodeoxyribonuclease-5